MATHTTCRRCNGKGRISAYHRIANGVCFDCGGSGDSSHPYVRLVPEAPSSGRVGSYGYPIVELDVILASLPAPQAHHAPEPAAAATPDPDVDWLALLLGD